MTSLSHKSTSTQTQDILECLLRAGGSDAAMTSSEIAKKVHGATRVSRALPELFKKGLVQREQRNIAGATVPVFHYWIDKPKPDVRFRSKKNDDCDEDTSAPSKRSNNAHTNKTSRNIEQLTKSVQGIVHVSPELEHELTELARVFAHRSAKSAALREKIDFLKLENARLDGQMTAGARRIKALKVQNEALREALELRDAAEKTESDEIERRIRRLTRLQRTPASTSEICSFIKKLRERPALEPLALLKQVQEDYERVLTSVRGE